MNISKKIISLFLFILSFAFVADAFAQRNVDYRGLAMKQEHQQQQMFFSTIILPGDSDSTVTFASVFSLSYNYLPFKKASQYSSNNSFFSTTELSLEVLQKENGDRGSIQNMDPVARSFWSDTAFANSYEETQSKQEFLEGNLSVTLKPGTYSYVIQMKRGDQSESQLSRSQHQEINLYSELKNGTIMYGEDAQPSDNPHEIRLSTMGDNVRYGEDFFALVYLPDYDPEVNYSIQIRQLQVSNGDTSNAGTVFSQKLSSQDIRQNVKPELTNRNGENIIELTSSESGFNYALVEVPNSTFANASYQMTVRNNDTNQITTQGQYRSRWVDIPTSLLSLDVAIDMLRFIVDEDTRRKISRGSQAESEKKFREFWKERDPTPETTYNELMAEYYRRIDYAYDNYTTENNIGYESDRGEVYIKFGAPENIERKYPTDGPTVEIWEYSNRRFIFRATTGFGDFKLVSE